MKVGDLVRLKTRPHDLWNMGLVLCDLYQGTYHEVWMDGHVFRFTQANLEVISEC